MNQTNDLTATAPGKGAEAGTTTSGRKSACLPDYSLNQIALQYPQALVYEHDPILQAEICELQAHKYELLAQFWRVTAALDSLTGKGEE